MKTLLTACTTALALASSATLGRAQAPSGCAKVEVQNLRTGQGPLMVAACTDADAASFRKTAASQLQLAVTGETMTIRVCGLAGDAVALTLFQDLNSNGKIDTNPFGMPTEPSGASGKPTSMTGPTWDTAQVPLAAETIVVKLSK